jgi:hypothetical protein
MPRAQAGVAAGIASTSRQVGQTLGVAVVGSLVAASTQHGDVGLASASRAGWWVLAGCGAATFALGLVATTSWAKGTAERTAALLNPGWS